MSRSNRDVGGYRGRKTVTDILRMIAIALAVVVVLVLAGVVYLQRYLVYTDDGASSSRCPPSAGPAGCCNRAQCRPGSSAPGRWGL